MTKTVIVCCNCGAVQDGITDKMFTLGRDPESRGFPTTWHTCSDGGKRRTKEITMDDDKLTKLIKATPKRTRPKPKFIIKKRRPSKEVKPVKIETEDKPMFKSPFSDLPHSYGRKIVDAEKKIVCYIPKSKAGIADHIRFVLHALTNHAGEPADAVDFTEKSVVKLPTDIAHTFATIKDHIIDQEGELKAETKKLDRFRDALDNL